MVGGAVDAHDDELFIAGRGQAEHVLSACHRSREHDEVMCAQLPRQSLLEDVRILVLELKIQQEALPLHSFSVQFPLK